VQVVYSYSRHMDLVAPVVWASNFPRQICTRSHFLAFRQIVAHRATIRGTQAAGQNRVLG